MADLSVFEQALDAAAKQGNVEAARSIVEDMRRHMQRENPQLGMPDEVKFGQANMPQSIKQVAQGEGVGEQRLAGIGSAVALSGHAIKDLFGQGDPAAIQDWKSLSKATPDTTMGNIAGNALEFGAIPPATLGPSAQAASKVLPSLKPTANALTSRLGTVGDMSLTQGGVNAALTPGDAPERIIAGGLGMTGAAIPGMAATGQGIRRATTSQGKQLALAEALRREVGGDAGAGKLIDQLENTRYGTQGYGVRPTGGMLTREPTLEVMETGSRTRTPDLWSNFDRTNAAARWQELERQAGTPQELERLRAARDALTTPMREGALQATGGAMQVGAGTPHQTLVDKLNDLATGANRPNRDVQTLVKYVQDEMDKGMTPEQLYTVRKMLTDGIKAGPTSELSQAARAARPQRMEIIGTIDQVLNEMSGGKWSQYLETYKQASPLISSRTAMGNIADKLRYGRPAGEVPMSMGEQPAPYTVGKLLESHGTKQFGSKDFDQLIPQHRSFMDALVADLNAQSAMMKSRSTLGSPTATNMANAGRVDAVTSGALEGVGGKLPFVGSVLAANVRGSMNRKAEEALAHLLQDPQALAETLRRAQAAQEMLNQSGRAGAGAGAAYRSGGQ